MRAGRFLSSARLWLAVFLVAVLSAVASPGAVAQGGPLPSWNQGEARNAILAFVAAVTTPGSPEFVPEAERIATFDMDGTLWVEQPYYPEVIFAYDRLAARAAAQPELAQSEPVRSILAGGHAGLPQLSAADLETLLSTAMSGMTPEAFGDEVRDWLAAARQPWLDEPFGALAYEPMLEVMAYLRDHGFRTYVVTGSSQAFARAFAGEVFGVPPEQVVGTARYTKFGYDGEGRPQLIRQPEMILNVSYGGKPEAIELFIGRRPVAAFGNSGGDADMLGYVTARQGRSLGMLVLHDDAQREFAYGPALGLPDTGVGVFNQALYDRARTAGWHVISMRRDWNAMFKAQK